MTDLIVPGRILTGEEAAAELAKLAAPLQVFVSNNGKVPVELYRDDQQNPGHRLRYKGEDAPNFHRMQDELVQNGRQSAVYWVNAHEWESVEG